MSVRKQHTHSLCTCAVSDLDAVLRRKHSGRRRPAQVRRLRHFAELAHNEPRVTAGRTGGTNKSDRTRLDISIACGRMEEFKRFDGELRSCFAQRAPGETPKKEHEEAQTRQGNVMHPFGRQPTQGALKEEPVHYQLRDATARARGASETPELELVWLETGGPPVSAPTGRG